jgi:hypothetical protein
MTYTTPKLNGKALHPEPKSNQKQSQIRPIKKEGKKSKGEWNVPNGEDAFGGSHARGQHQELQAQADEEEEGELLQHVEEILLLQNPF